MATNFGPYQATIDAFTAKGFETEIFEGKYYVVYTGPDTPVAHFVLGKVIERNGAYALNGMRGYYSTTIEKHVKFLQHVTRDTYNWYLGGMRAYSKLVSDEAEFKATQATATAAKNAAKAAKKPAAATKIVQPVAQPAIVLAIANRGVRVEKPAVVVEQKPAVPVAPKVRKAKKSA